MTTSIDNSDISSSMTEPTGHIDLLIIDIIIYSISNSLSKKLNETTK